MNTHNFSKYFQHISKGFFLLIWMVGILLGIVAASSSLYLSLAVLAAFKETPNTIGFFSLCLCRIISFYFALHYKKFWVTYLLLFIDAFCLGFCGIAVYMVVGESAWLLRPLLTFSSVWCYVPIWWILLSRTNPSKMHSLCAVCFSGVVMLINYTVITPVLTDLAKYL